jgi:hypothetical protein
VNGFALPLADFGNIYLCLQPPLPGDWLKEIYLGLTQFEVKVPKNGVLIGLRPINTPFFGLLKLQLRNSF